MEKLKNCMCGESVKVTKDMSGQCFIHCIYCDIGTMTGTLDEEDLIRRWNDRPSGWISVDDRLPEENRETMRYIQLNLVLKNRTVIQGGFHHGSFWVDGVKYYNVTHYMYPLDPPKNHQSR